MTREAREALQNISEYPEGRTPYGYGPISPNTRELVASNCIEIESISTPEGEFWVAKITPHGRAALLV